VAVGEGVFEDAAADAAGGAEEGDLHGAMKVEG